MSVDKRGDELIGDSSKDTRDHNPESYPAVQNALPTSLESGQSAKVYNEVRNALATFTEEVKKLTSSSGTSESQQLLQASLLELSKISEALFTLKISGITSLQSEQPEKLERMLAIIESLQNSVFSLSSGTEALQKSLVITKQESAIAAQKELQEIAARLIKFFLQKINEVDKAKKELQSKLDGGFLPAQALTDITNAYKGLSAGQDEKLKRLEAAAQAVLLENRGLKNENQALADEVTKLRTALTIANIPLETTNETPTASFPLLRSDAASFPTELSLPQETSAIKTPPTKALTVEKQLSFDELPLESGASFIGTGEVTANLKAASKTPSLKAPETNPGNFSLENWARNIAARETDIPSNLSREELRNFIFNTYNLNLFFSAQERMDSFSKHLEINKEDKLVTISFPLVTGKMMKFEEVAVFGNGILAMEFFTLIRRAIQNYFNPKTILNVDASVDPLCFSFFAFPSLNNEDIVQKIEESFSGELRATYASDISSYIKNGYFQFTAKGKTQGISLFNSNERGSNLTVGLDDGNGVNVSVELKPDIKVFFNNGNQESTT